MRDNLRRAVWLGLGLGILLGAPLSYAQTLVWGTVRDTDGAPVEGAEIFFANQADSLKVVSAQTAADGAYAADLAPIIGSTGVGAESWGEVKGDSRPLRRKSAGSSGWANLLFQVEIRGEEIEPFFQRDVVVPEDRKLDFAVVRLPVSQGVLIDSTLAETIFQVFQAAFFASLIRDPTTVEGESGQLTISGDTWIFADYSPDGELFIAGELEVKKDLFPRIPVQGDLLLSGSHQGILNVDMTVIVEGLNFRVEGVLTLNGQQLDLAGQ